METTVVLPKFNLKEKLFKIYPENSIWRTSYTLRIISIWFIFYIMGAVVPLIMMQNHIMPVIMPFFIIIWLSILIFIYSAYCLSIKRTRDFWGKEWLPKVAFATVAILLLATTFSLIPESANVNTGWFTFYIIYLSAVKSKLTELTETKLEETKIASSVSL